MPRELQDMVVKLALWFRMRQPSLCHPPWPPTRLKFQEADTASEPRANRRRVMFTGVLRMCRDMPSDGKQTDVDFIEAISSILVARV